MTKTTAGLVNIKDWRKYQAESTLFSYKYIRFLLSPSVLEHIQQHRYSTVKIFPLFFSLDASTSARMKQSSQLLKTCDEKQFQQDLERAKVRTSSPVDFKSYVLNSVLTHTTAFQSRQPDTPPEVKGEHLHTCRHFKAVTSLLPEETIPLL